MGKGKALDSLKGAKKLYRQFRFEKLRDQKKKVYGRERCFERGRKMIRGEAYWRGLLETIACVYFGLGGGGPGEGGGDGIFSKRQEGRLS